MSENLSDIVIDARHLKKSYYIGENEIKALDDVSFSVKKAEMVVIVGYSGSGKSTLLNSIASLCSADSGELYVKGQDILKFRESEKNNYRKKEVGIVFQSYNLLADLTVWENVVFGKKTSGSSKSVEEALELVGMAERKNHYLSQLSGGEQQRASIARAIVKGSDLVLCDEPTGALDVENSRQVLELLEKLVREENKTVLIVTHNEIITEAADHVLVMRDGKIIEERYNQKPLCVKELEW